MRSVRGTFTMLEKAFRGSLTEKVTFYQKHAGGERRSPVDTVGRSFEAESIANAKTLR